MPTPAPKSGGLIRVSNELATKALKGARLSKTLRNAKRDKKAIDTDFKQLFADAGVDVTVATFGGKAVALAHHRSPNRFNLTKFAEDHPELVRQYTEPGPYVEIEYL